MDYEVTIIGGDAPEIKEENVRYLHCDPQNGLRQTSDGYIIFLSPGDRNYPSRVGEQLQIITANNADICFCGASADEGEDFDPRGLVGVIPPGTISVANLCLSAAMFRVKWLKSAVGSEKIASDNRYFWIKATRGANCSYTDRVLLSVGVNYPQSFIELYGSREQSKHHPLMRYHLEHEKLKNSSLYKIAKIPSLLGDIFKR